MGYLSQSNKQLNPLKRNLYYILFIFYATCLLGQTWKPIGPFNRAGGNGQGAGRIKTIAFHPLYGAVDPFLGTINNTVFAGSPWGGIWISRDAGANWSTTDPLKQYPDLTTDFLPGCGVMDIVVDKFNPTTIYAALNTGETPVNLPALKLTVIPSAGIYKYTPSTGWLPKYSYPYNSKKAIMQIAMYPGNNKIIFGCTSDGIIRSKDGGTSWATVLTAGVDKPFRNIVFNPKNPLIVYASGQDIYKSTDGGVTWGTGPISSFRTIIPGNDFTILSNIVVKSSSTLYASIVYQDNTVNCARQYAFYRYNGTSWIAMPNFPKYNDPQYDRFPLALKTISGIDYVFAGQELVQRYSSATNTWTTISDYGGCMHPDIHELVFTPNGAALFVGHDGGISKATSNFYSSKPNWTTINKGLSIATIYSFAGAQKNPKLFLSGELDNGNSIVKNADENNFDSISWKGYGMADGGDKMISWDNPNEWYDREAMYGGDFRNHRNTTGEPSYNSPAVFTNSTIDPPPTAIWTPHMLFEEWGSRKPLVMDPNNTNIVYRAANILIRSTDSGATSKVIFRKTDCFNIGTDDWNSHITCIAIASSNSNYLYINFNNPYVYEPRLTNHIYKTTNALSSTYKAACPHSETDGVVCRNWTEITPPFPDVASVILKKSLITSIVVSDKDPNIIWAGFSYNPGILNFKVWKYDGITWSDWGAGLPQNTSITSLVYENGSNDDIYAGTDVAGVYYRNNSMSGWIQYGAGLPHASIIQMEINYTDSTLRVGTMGRGIWKTNLHVAVH